MAQIPTAEKFLIINDDKDFKLSMSGRNVSEMMIAFAKLHVEAALKEASEDVELETYGNFGNSVNKDSILNAYPLTNIK